MQSNVLPIIKPLKVNGKEIEIIGIPGTGEQALYRRNSK